MNDYPHNLVINYSYEFPSDLERSSSMAVELWKDTWRLATLGDSAISEWGPSDHNKRSEYPVPSHRHALCRAGECGARG